MSGGIWTPMRETIARDLWRQRFSGSFIARRLDGVFAPGEIVAHAIAAGWARAAARVARRHPCIECHAPNTAMRAGTRCDVCSARNKREGTRVRGARRDARNAARQATPRPAQRRKTVALSIATPIIAPPAPDPAQLTLLPVDVGPQPFDVARIDPVTLYRAERAHRAAQFRTTVLPAVQSRLDAMSEAEQATKYQLRGRPRKDGRTARLQGAA